jgi:hypothetical protein
MNEKSVQPHFFVQNLIIHLFGIVLVHDIFQPASRPVGQLASLVAVKKPVQARPAGRPGQ